MKRKVLLVGLNAKESIVPLGLGYIKAYAEKSGEIRKNFDISLISTFANAAGISEIEREIKKIRPDIVGFSCNVWNILPILKICSKTKLAIPKTNVVLGGPEASFELLKENNFIDFLLVGEGELSFYQLLLALIGRFDIKKINGLGYRYNSSILLNHVESVKNLELSQVPSPYLNSIFDPTKYKIALLECSRGCPFCCKFCSQAGRFSGVRFHPEKKLIKELIFLLNKTKRVRFVDDNLNIDIKRCKHILYFVKHSNFEKVLISLNYLNIDKELAKLIDDSPCVSAEIGLQSSNEGVLKEINKEVNLKRFKKTINLFRNKKKICIDLILGLPKDSPLSFINSLKFVLTLGTMLHVERLSIQQKSKLKTEVEKYGLHYNLSPPYYLEESPTFKKEELKYLSILSKSIMKLSRIN